MIRASEIFTSGELKFLKPKIKKLKSMFTWQKVIIRVGGKVIAVEENKLSNGD